MTSKVRYCTYNTAELFHCVSALANGWKALYVECVWGGERILCIHNIPSTHTYPSHFLCMQKKCVCRGGQLVVLVFRMCVVWCVALSLPSHHLVPPSSV